jgi:hypothetical protein
MAGKAPRSMSYDFIPTVFQTLAPPVVQKKRRDRVHAVIRFKKAESGALKHTRAYGSTGTYADEVTKTHTKTPDNFLVTVWRSG